MKVLLLIICCCILTILYYVKSQNNNKFTSKSKGFTMEIPKKENIGNLLKLMFEYDYNELNSVLIDELDLQTIYYMMHTKLTEIIILIASDFPYLTSKLILAFRVDTIELKDFKKKIIFYLRLLNSKVKEINPNKFKYFHLYLFLGHINVFLKYLARKTISNISTIEHFNYNIDIITKYMCNYINENTKVFNDKIIYNILNK